MGNRKSITESYLKYKESALSLYDGLLTNADSQSSIILIEALREIEAGHKKDILTHQEIKMPNMNIALSDALSLTPTDEFRSLSRIFDSILAFKEKSFESYSNEIKKIHGEQIEHLPIIQSIKTAESHILRLLKSEKRKCMLDH